MWLFPECGDECDVLWMRMGEWAYLLEMVGVKSRNHAVVEMILFHNECRNETLAEGEDGLLFDELCWEEGVL